MTQKLTLARYLDARGAVRVLTSIEARAFGVPYPLVSGWARRFGDVEITPAMIDRLRAKIGLAQTATTAKAKRGLDAAMGLRAARVDGASLTRGARTVAMFPGFALRVARHNSDAGPPWKI